MLEANILLKPSPISNSLLDKYKQTIPQRSEQALEDYKSEKRNHLINFYHVGRDNVLPIKIITQH